MSRMKDLFLSIHDANIVEEEEECQFCGEETCEECEERILDEQTEYNMEYEQEREAGIYD